MQTLMISDITLRETKSEAYSFREKIEIAKQLDIMGVDVIETAEVSDSKTDTLFLHTIAPLIRKGILSAATGYTEASLLRAWNGIKEAKKPRLNIMVPTSPVQMEYICHKKPKAAAEMINLLVTKAKELCKDVEFTAMDATRSEPEFLALAIKTAINAGATTVTLCDTEGTRFSDEFAAFVSSVKQNVPEIENVTLSVECSDSMNMGAASELAAAAVGARQIKSSALGITVPKVESIANIIKMRGDSIDISASLNQTTLRHAVEKIMSFSQAGVLRTNDKTKEEAPSSVFSLKKGDDEKTVAECVQKLGYELSEEDMGKVYESFIRLAEKKNEISSKELEAIIASSAMQVAPTYVLKSYVINSGNIITSTAHIELEKDGKTVSGISIGDGPIDAAFRAIEQIIGHHFELDDFQIQSVTEGSRAMGDALVKLRTDGKLFSGRGISTDIIGASIRAYISALNKICFEEA